MKNREQRKDRERGTGNREQGTELASRSGCQHNLITNNNPSPKSLFPCPCTVPIPYLIIFILTFFPLRATAQEIDHLAAFSDPARIWGNGVERVIEEAYRTCFKTRIIGDRILNIRIPFAQNNERQPLSNMEWDFLWEGKGNPALLWPVIEQILDSSAFAKYAETISNGREQVIIFNIPTQSWRSSTELFDIARMKAGSYRGLPHRPQVLVSGRGVDVSDVYNYLYCVGHVGIDCSGFVFYVLTYLANYGGLDLGQAINRALGISKDKNASWYVGTSFYNSTSSQLIAVKDEIANLRPADIILFRRAADGEISHSAVIQSIDFTRGIVRYLQCTDDAPLNERGIHESFIYFDPAKPRTSLKDTSLNWTQKRYAPFPGEMDEPFSNDGARYRAHSNLGGGRIVRLRALEPVIKKINAGQ